MTPEEAPRILSSHAMRVETNGAFGTETVVDLTPPPMAWIKALESGLIQSVKFSMRDGELCAEIEYIRQLDEVRIPADWPGLQIQAEKS
jgi:hypothetical protein